MIRRDAREAEGARLEIVCMPTKMYRGFESPSLRHFIFFAKRYLPAAEAIFLTGFLFKMDSRAPCNDGL